MGTQIDRSQRIAGLPALEVRNLLRKVAGSSFRRGWFEEKGLGTEQACHLIDALLEAAFLEPDPIPTLEPELGSFYKLTEEGETFIRSTGAKPLKRRTVELALSEFLARVQEVNRSAEFLLKITEVIVFGSYLSNKETLGDLDIACRYELKSASENTRAYAQRVHEHFKASGRRSKGIADMFWPWEQVDLFLKNKKRTISLHSVDELERLIAGSPKLKWLLLMGDQAEFESRIKAKQ